MKQMVKAIMLSVLVSALAVWQSSCTKPAAQSAESTPHATSTSVPAKAPPSSSGVVVASGVVQPAQWVTLSFQLRGVVAEVAVTPGDEVQAGQLLARLEATRLEQAVVQSEAALAIARAQLAQTQAGARPEEVAVVNATVAAAEPQLAQAQANLSQVEGGIEFARAGLKQAQAQLSAAQAGQAQAEAGLSGARAGLASAQAGLAQLQAGPDEQAVEISRLNWESAKNSVWRTQLERDAILGRSGVPDYQKELAKATFWAAEISASIAQLEYELAAEARLTNSCSRPRRR